MREYLCLAMLLALPACSKTLASFEGDITMHTTTARGDAHDLVVKAKGDKLRFDTTSGTHAVFDPSAHKVLFFMDTQKRYMDMDFTSPTAAPSTDPGTSNITQSGTHKKIAGYDCEQWSVKDASGKRSDVCMAQGIAFFDMNSLRGGPTSESPMARAFREKKSFPLESIDYDAQGKELARMEVVKIDKKKIDDGDFGVPSGYEKMEMPKGGVH